MIDKTQKLSDIIIEHPSIITVLNRFNIFLGVGDKTVEQMCLEKNLNTDFFVIILNTYSHEEYFPEKLLKNFDVALIINYLNSTNDYYCQFIIHNIENHFNLLLKCSKDENTNIELLYNFFIEVKTELLNRINYDTDVLFKEILSLDKEPSNNTNSEANYIKIQPYDNINDAIEDKVGDLVNMFVIHLRGKYNPNLCIAVLSAIINLKRDLCQNNRIRNRILMPIYHHLKDRYTNA